jgi:two-component system nitrogen regulation sensor histidine kinase NtrY
MEVLPEIGELLSKAHERPNKITQSEILYVGNKDRRLTLLVRIGMELIGDQEIGAILTFDDITELQSAQRKAAWADVARRIAHEIKNPLTPIQLSQSV